MDNPDIWLGGHINALRGIVRCTQAELGDAIGVSQSTMGKKLRGEVGISFGELIRLADFMNLAVEDLIPPIYAGEPKIGARGRRAADQLPRLDSNQQPSGYRLRLVAGLFGGDKPARRRRGDRHRGAVRSGQCWCPDGARVHHPSCPLRGLERDGLVLAA